MVVDLEGKRSIGRPHHGAAHRADALAQRQRFPIFRIRALHQCLEPVPAAKDRIERQARKGRQRSEKDQRENEQAILHGCDSGVRQTIVK